VNSRPARHAVATLAVTAAFLGAWPSGAAAQLPDLTGTWVGTLTCKSFDTGLKTKLALEPVLQISQSGNEVGARLDFGGTQEEYDGLANPDGKKPATKGELALIRCSTDSVAGNDFGSDEPDFDEIGRFAVGAKPGKIKASLKGQSFFSDPGVASPEAGSCKWRFTRIDTADPGITPTCPAPMMVRAAQGRTARHRR
jgi:hypothetical protein